MFEPPGTPTFLLLAAEEWEALSDGLTTGATAPTLSRIVAPDEYQKEKHYWKFANLIGRIGKLSVYAIAIKFFGMATTGLI